MGHLLYLMFRCDFNVMENLEECEGSEHNLSKTVTNGPLVLSSPLWTRGNKVAAARFIHEPCRTYDTVTLHIRGLLTVLKYYLIALFLHTKRCF